MTGHDDTGRGDNARQDGARQDGAHFDEMDAVRRFPSEHEWLDLSMPSGSPAGDSTQVDSTQVDSTQVDSTQVDSTQGESTQGESTPEMPPGGRFAGEQTFADRVMQARRDEQELDRQLDALSSELPSEFLQHFTAPAASPGFVDGTAALVRQERLHRWQTLLARYVAPEPSPAFVSRTLAALTDGEDSTADGTTRGEADRSSTTGGQGERLPRRRSTRPPWLTMGLTASAAAALLWLTLTPTGPTPLELRLAQRASPAVAYTTTPLAAVLDQVADEDEPFAAFGEPADGLWLLSASGDAR